MALHKYLKKIKPEGKCKSGKDSISSSRANANMAGRGGVRRVLEESASVACHCVRVLCIGHLPFAADVFDASGGHLKRSVSTTSANAISIEPCYNSFVHFVDFNALIVS